MAKPKKKKPIKTINPINESLIEEIFETFIEFECPTRGKVKQKVLVKKYRTIDARLIPIVSDPSLVSKLDDSDIIKAVDFMPEDNE